MGMVRCSSDKPVENDPD